MDCYDAPEYWDLAFRDETQPEADFIQQAAVRYLGTDCPDVLEIGCGGGRQVIELCRRGMNVSAIDLNASCVAYVNRLLKRRRLTASVTQADMTSYVKSKPVDLVHCLVNTFRHLTTEQAAMQHLHAVAESLRPGGIYLLGFHLLPPDADEEDCERWSVTQGSTRVSATIRVMEFHRRRRLETLRFSLRVTRPDGILRMRTDHTLRIYRADQFRSLIRKVRSLELLDVFDFWYELDHPLVLNDALGDAVFVLRRRA